MKAKTCLGCGGKYQPEPYHPSFQRWCGIDCAIKVSRAKQERNKAKVRARVVATEKKRQKARKEAVKTKTEWANEAQSAFNLFIRIRDMGQPCLMCDKPDDGSHQRHACHYRTVKAAKQLRYCTWNVHAGCAQCNVHDSGNVVEYRIRLVNKIGADRVEQIECNHELCTHDIEYYRRIKRMFAKRAKLYKRIKGL